jgi:N-acetylneuraminate synthase/N,N'-diacetyllegionaminate synthase
MNFNFEKPFIIAEIGGNHEGSLDYAKDLLIQAAEAGADAVKFQTYFPDKIVSKVEDPNRHKHFSKFSLPIDDYFDLAELAKENKIMFMSSIWDSESLEALDSIISIHKIGSGDLTNYPLIKEIISTGKPLIISTAMSTMKEVEDTVKFIEDSQPDYQDLNKLAILQCVAMYGEPKDKYANLNVISSLSEKFPNHTIGYSDHTVGNYAANIAVALGAKILELHFTDDKSRDFRDHHISVTKEELLDLKKNIFKTHALQGASTKGPVLEIETSDRIFEFRRSCYLKHDCKSGDIITEDNLITLRPNKGIDSRDFFKLLGKKLLVNKKAFEAIYWDDLED